jgi:hypothetical protein
MKTKHLFTFLVLLSLISSGMLLTEVSSIAGTNSTRDTLKDPHPPTPSPRAGEGEPEHQAKFLAPSPALGEGWGEGLSMSSLEFLIAQGEKPTTKVSKPAQSSIPAKSNEASPSSDTTIPATSPTTILSPAAGVSNAEARKNAKADEEPQIVPWILGGLSGLLHLIEIAGMVWAYLKINQLSEKSRDSRSQIKSLTDKLNTSEQKLKTQGDQLKTIGSEAANARNLTSRMNAIEQASQRKSNDIGYADPNYNLPSPGVAKAAAAPSLYPFLDTYRQSSDIFKNQYSPKIVSEDADNLQKRRAGDYQEIILGEDRQGNYWLFNDGSTTYLVPSPKLKINDLNIRTAGGLFTCENYTPGYQHINIVRPAIVSAQTGMGERWKLEQKGVLEFA